MCPRHPARYLHKVMSHESGMNCGVTVRLPQFGRNVGVKQLRSREIGNLEAAHVEASRLEVDVFVRDGQLRDVRAHTSAHGTWRIDISTCWFTPVRDDGELCLGCAPGVADVLVELSTCDHSRHAHTSLYVDRMLHRL